MKAWVVLLLVPLAGCYRYSYVRIEPGGRNAVALDEQVTHQRIRTSVLWGLAAAPDFAPSGPAACDHGAGRVEVIVPIWAVLVNVVTVGIVAPARVKVYCATDPDLGGRDRLGPAGPAGPRPEVP